MNLFGPDPLREQVIGHLSYDPDMGKLRDAPDERSFGDKFAGDVVGAMVAVGGAVVYAVYGVVLGTLAVVRGVVEAVVDGVATAGITAALGTKRSATWAHNRTETHSALTDEKARDTRARHAVRYNPFVVTGAQAAAYQAQDTGTPLSPKAERVVQAARDIVDSGASGRRVSGKAALIAATAGHVRNNGGGPSGGRSVAWFVANERVISRLTTPQVAPDADLPPERQVEVQDLKSEIAQRLHDSVGGADLTLDEAGNVQVDRRTSVAISRLQGGIPGVEPGQGLTVVALEIAAGR